MKLTQTIKRQLRKANDRKMFAVFCFALFLLVGFVILMVRLHRMEERLKVAFPGDYAAENAQELRHLVGFVALYLVAGLLVYYVIQMIWAYNREKSNALVREIENLLIESANNPDNFRVALEQINAYTASSVTALVYEEGTAHRTKCVGDNEMRRGIYAAEHERRVELYKCAAEYPEGAIRRRNGSMRKQYPQVYEYMDEHKANNIVLVPIMDADGNVTDLAGVANSQRPRYALEILKVLACPMSLAMHNCRYFAAMNKSVTTDALTGLQNRLAFDRWMEQCNPESLIRFGCVYIDVNELHTVNNRDGHETGDDMLREISQLLLAQFAVDTVYRIGGDEFVVISEKMDEGEMRKRMEHVNRILSQKNYYISYGLVWGENSVDPQALIRAAEERMYEDKYLYYQKREQKNLAEIEEWEIVPGDASDDAVRTFTKVAGQHFRAVFEVDPEKDEAHGVSMPSYFSVLLEKHQGSFRQSCYDYVQSMVDKSYHRAIDEFFNYPQIIQMLSRGERPIVRYRRIDGQGVVVRVYPLESFADSHRMLWIMETVN